MTIEFRKASKSDFSATGSVVDEAFKAKGSEDTAMFLDQLRSDGCILGEWLAEDISGVLAHIVFSRVVLVQTDGRRITAAMLTPLAVRPQQQRRGIGLGLANHALEELEERGETLFFVLGIPDYYPRVGFSHHLASDVSSPWTGNRAFMARSKSKPQGQLILPKSIANAH